MAARSLRVDAKADDVLAALDRYATGRAGSAERVPLQDGTRVRMRVAGALIGLNVYPAKERGCTLVFDRPEAPEAGEIAAMLGARPSPTRAAKTPSRGIAPVLADTPCWIGSDESGKGDYFGPLVVAAVAVTADNWRALEALGVQDSKALTDARAGSLAAEIRAAYPHDVVAVMPPRYNDLWETFGRNVNRLLAWAHARAIENVVEQAPAAVAAVADQFGDESLIRDALFKRGRELRLVQMPRAERDPAVAAASLLARAEFVRRLDQLGREAGVRLPKGASSAVEAAARALVARDGAQALRRMAKVHFRTTQRVV